MLSGNQELKENKMDIKTVPGFKFHFDQVIFGPLDRLVSNQDYLIGFIFIPLCSENENVPRGAGRQCANEGGGRGRSDYLQAKGTVFDGG